MTRTEGGRRARRAERRRQQIMETAARVFARYGYERATTREIAGAAGISEGSIDNCFASKQQLLLELAEMVQEKLGAIILPLAAASPTELWPLPGPACRTLR